MMQILPFAQHGGIQMLWKRKFAKRCTPNHARLDLESCLRRIDVGRNLNQVTVWITTIDRDQRSRCPLLLDRPLLDCDSMSAQVLDNDIRIGLGEEAKIIAPGGLVIGRGDAYNGNHDFDRATADLNEAIRLDPQLAAAYAGRGFAYYYHRELEKAFTDYNEAIRLDPHNAIAYLDRGAAYMDKGDIDKAIGDFTEAIRLDPKFASPYYYRGAVYRSTGNSDKANADFATARRLDAGQ